MQAGAASTEKQYRENGKQQFLRAAGTFPA
jgi:hypothetical protein